MHGLLYIYYMQQLCGYGVLIIEVSTFCSVGAAIYGKTFKGETYEVMIEMNAHRKTFVVAASFNIECLLPVNYLT